MTSSTTSEGVTTTYSYDGFERQHVATDARGNTTTTAYDASGRVYTVTDGAGAVTTYAYNQAGDSGYPGRVKSIKNAANKYTYFTYSDRGETLRTWGDVPYPTAMHYDAFGQRDKLSTFRDTGAGWDSSTWPGSVDPDDAADADITQWTYDGATGLLNTKTYADSSSVGYAYSGGGLLLTRDWAREVGSSDPLTTTYAYDPNTAELLSVSYDDSTTSVVYTYDRLGRIATVDDAAGTREFSYDPDSLLPTGERFTVGRFSGSGTNDLVVSMTHETLSGASAGTRFSGIQVGIPGDHDQNYAAAYAYDGFGRLNHVGGPGLPGGGGSSGADYTFANSGGGSPVEYGLVDKLEVKNSGGTVQTWTDYTYDADRDVVAAVENNYRSGGSQVTLSRYTYLYDNLVRRSEVSYEGSAFSATHVDNLSYDDRNEVTHSRRYATTQPTTTQPAATQPSDLITAANRSYGYDPIGNRLFSDSGVHYQYNDPNDPNYGTPVQATYTANKLNQYTKVEFEPNPREKLAYDADGNLTEIFLMADLDQDGDIDISDLALITGHMGESAGIGNNTYASEAVFARADMSGNGTIDVSDLAVVLGDFGYTADSGTWVIFGWDGENRLISTTPQAAQTGWRRCEFDYDYLGRRIEKRVFTYGASSWNTHPTERRRFVWYNWLMVMEIVETDTDSPPDGAMDTNRVRRFTWGRDLGGGLESAGGIGGLLAVDDNNGTTTGGSPTADDMHYVYAYDVNGNVGQLVDWAAGSAGSSLAAKYEYDVYGNQSAHTGSYEAVNTFRFSTKYWDDETGLGYWGYRYYDPRLGRWMSRDPIGERGGLDLFAAISNNPSNVHDALGRLSLAEGVAGKTSCGKSKCQPSQSDDQSSSANEESSPSPETPKPDDPPAGRGSTCGIKIKRSSICTLSPEDSWEFGHEWIDVGDGTTLDFPRGYIKLPCEQVCPDEAVWVHNAHVRLLGGNLPNGTSCAKATCSQIRECLQKANEESQWDRENYQFFKHNCISYVQYATSKCCLSKGLLPTRSPGWGEESRRCEERKICHKKHPTECGSGSP